mgnify:CR=1 FL=1
MKTPATQPIEQHPLGFFLPENTKLLMLGSFPPPRARWSMNFYYRISKTTCGGYSDWFSITIKNIS